MYIIKHANGETIQKNFELTTLRHKPTLHSSLFAGGRRTGFFNDAYDTGRKGYVLH